MGKKILLVDDEKDIVKVMAYRLENAGYEVIPAYEGKEALEKAQDKAPDIILLDIMMPGMDGLEVLYQLKRDSKTTGTPVIMLTCKGEAKSILKAQKIGASDYLIKPADSKELLKTIRKYTDI